MRELNPAGRRRIVILVTKEAHCLGDLLMKAIPAAWMSKSRQLLVTTILYVLWLSVLIFHL
ncbi:hypothetical protein ACLBR5_18460 [Escherichia coli]